MLKKPFSTGDEPEDGPQLYVLIMGFHQPELIRALDASDVHVENIIKLCVDKLPTMTPQSPVMEQDEEQDTDEEGESNESNAEEGKELSNQHTFTEHHCTTAVMTSYPVCVRSRDRCTCGCPCGQVGELLVWSGFSFGKWVSRFQT